MAVESPEDADITTSGCFLIILPIICYMILLHYQFLFLKLNTFRIQILSLRTALALPLYSLLILFSLISPQYFDWFNVLIAIIEGYSFRCFLTLLVTNMGGKTKTLVLLKDASSLICCNCQSKEKLLERLYWNTFNFQFIRPIIVVLIALFRERRGVYLLLSFVVFLMVVVPVILTVLFFENIYEFNKNLNAITKLLVIKLSVGLIVSQGIIVEVLIATNSLNLSDSAPFTAGERAIRILCVILLIEYAILSLVMYATYSLEIIPSELDSNEDNPIVVQKLDISYFEYIRRLFMFHDIYFESNDRTYLNDNLLANGEIEDQSAYVQA